MEIEEFNELVKAKLMDIYNEYRKILTEGEEVYLSLCISEDPKDENREPGTIFWNNNHYNNVEIPKVDKGFFVRNGKEVNYPEDDFEV